MNSEQSKPSYKLIVELSADNKDLEEFIYFLNLSATSWQKHGRISDYKLIIEDLKKKSK